MNTPFYDFFFFFFQTHSYSQYQFPWHSYLSISISPIRSQLQWRFILVTVFNAQMITDHGRMYGRGLRKGERMSAPTRDLIILPTIPIHYSLSCYYYAWLYDMIYPCLDRSLYTNRKTFVLLNKRKGRIGEWQLPLPTMMTNRLISVCFSLQESLFSSDVASLFW